jgi:hypothetical protein
MSFSSGVTDSGPTARDSASLLWASRRWAYADSAACCASRSPRAMRPSDSGGIIAAPQPGQLLFGRLDIAPRALDLLALAGNLLLLGRDGVLVVLLLFDGKPIGVAGVGQLEVRVGNDPLILGIHRLQGIGPSLLQRRGAALQALQLRVQLLGRTLLLRHRGLQGFELGQLGRDLLLELGDILRQGEAGPQQQ